MKEKKERSISALLKEKRNLWFLLLIPAVAMYLTAKHSADAAENVFARGTYRFFGGIMSRVNDLFPFSVLEIAVILLIPAFIVAFVGGFFKIVIVRNSEHKGKARLEILLRFLRNLLLMGTLLLFLFMIGCGTNYYRYEFVTFSGLKVEKSTKEELAGLFSELVAKANESRAALNLAEGEVFTSRLSFSERAETASEAMNALGDKYEVLAGYYPDVKPVLLSRLMSQFGITGMYSPFTVEANVNTDSPEYLRAMNCCHELSHLRGFMREDEANYIGYLGCVNSGDPEFVYSGYVSAVIHIGNRLYDSDAELFYELADYSDGVRLDLIKANEYWDSFRDTEIGETLSNAGESLNNAYLNANGIEDGTKSYGRYADLLLAEYRKRMEEGDNNEVLK